MSSSLQQLVSCFALRAFPHFPHHPLVVQKINICRVDCPCACGKCVSFRLHFVPGSAVVPPLTLHFILPTLQAYTSAPLGFGKYSFPFRKLHSFRFPQPFSYAFSVVNIFFCDEFTPNKLKSVCDNGIRS